MEGDDRMDDAPQHEQDEEMSADWLRRNRPSETEDFIKLLDLQLSPGLHPDVIRALRRAEKHFPIK